MTETADIHADPDAYAAATGGAAVYDRGAGGRLAFSGADHLEFLHRMSTQHLTGLGVGAGLPAVFCDNRGRIAEVAELCRPDAQTTVAFLDPGRAAPLLTWLEGYHFAEDIEWEDRSQTDGELLLVGPAVDGLARQVLGVDPDTWQDRQVQPVAGGHAQWLSGPGGPALRLWGPAAEVAASGARLQAAGARAIDAATWEILRVEAGRPVAGRELTLDHNPWEAGLDAAVHLNKGCYIGQEVVARLDTYDKVKQRLVGLRLQAPVATGATVTAGGRAVGHVTSAVVSPRLGPVALAYVRTGHCEPGSSVAVESAGGESAGETMGATLAALPFDGPR